MLTTTKYIEQLEKQNRILALSLCEKYGNGSVSKGLEVIKEKYSKRPFDGAFGDLKVIIDIMENVSCDYKDIPPPPPPPPCRKVKSYF